MPCEGPERGHQFKTSLDFDTKPPVATAGILTELSGKNCIMNRKYLGGNLRRREGLADVTIY